MSLIFSTGNTLVMQGKILTKINQKKKNTAFCFY